jgi:hypothetical protein
MQQSPDLATQIAADHQIWLDFLAICDCGGRLAGTESETRAFALVEIRAEAATGTKGRSILFAYGGWSATEASLLLPAGAAGCHPLVRSVATPPGWAHGWVVDLGRGAGGDRAHAARTRGRISRWCGTS